MQLKSMEGSKMSSFIAYSMPGESDYLFCPIKNSEKLLPNSKLNKYDFVIAPFDPSKHHSYGLYFDRMELNGKFKLKIASKISRQSIPKEQYLDICNQLVSEIRESEVSKVVLSRIKTLEFYTDNLSELYCELVAQYPDAFVYLLVHPEIGVWMGATPEVLLSQADGEACTIALAGTQEYSPAGDYHWTQKEIEEHVYVEQSIAEQLTKNNLAFEKSKSYTVRAGQVAHLKSEFKFDAKDLEATVRALHPSPAIGAYPKEFAYKMIDKYEGHDRRYYCGYLGPVSENSANLFINLRCMELSSNAAYLYLGGGITADSQSEKEWIETELKAQTLMNVISKPTIV